MSYPESNAEFIKGYVPVAFPVLGWVGGTMAGAMRFDRSEPYLEEINELNTANTSLSEVQAELQDNPEAQQIIESRITQNNEQITSLSVTVNQYQSKSDMFESMGIGTGSGILAAVLVVGGIKLWAKNHRNTITTTPTTSD